MTVERLLKEVLSFADDDLCHDWHEAFDSLIVKMRSGNSRTMRDLNFLQRLEEFRNQLKPKEGNL